MTNADKIRANRVNARASTGPKTAAGRARAARNAFRHALSIPITRDPILFKEAETLAYKIAGPHASPEILELARHIAEAQIDLRRVRQARHQLLTSALSRFYELRSHRMAKMRFVASLLRPRAPDIPFEFVCAVLQTGPRGPHKFATILAGEARRLSAFDRYERRTLSRRKFAIRAFDHALQP